MNTVKKLVHILDKTDRLKALGVLCAFLVTGVLQLTGVGSILPFVSLLSNPDSVHTNEWLSWVFVSLGFQSVQSFLFFLGFVTLFAVLLSNSFMAFSEWLIVRFARSLQARLSIDLLRNYLFRPYSLSLNENSADKTKNVLEETNTLANGVVLPLFSFLVSGVTSLLIIGFLIWLHPMLASLLTLIIGGGYASIYLVAHGKLNLHGNQRFHQNARRFKAVNEALGGLKEVKAMGKESRLIDQFVGPTFAYADARVMQAVWRQIPRYSIEILGFGGILLIVLYLMGVEGEVSQIVPLASVYAFGGMRIMQALKKVYAALSDIRTNKIVLDTLHNEIRKTEEEHGKQISTNSRNQDSPTLHMFQNIFLKNITFTYPGDDSPTLRDINMQIPSGSSVAFVGESGAGKSTIIDLILGLLIPQKGTIEVDGKDIHKHLTAWRNQLGYVPQSIYLSDATLASNISFGLKSEQMDLKRVQKAARIANIHDFVINELPDGYDTLVGENGVRLSGGQRQRIGIARAIYEDPDILCLDEATNELDTITEKKVLDSIETISSTKTIITVAHNLRTLDNYDYIFILDDGKVVGEGSYDNLIEMNQKFRSLAFS